MSDEETDSEVVISYPSAKVGAITRVKNEITNYTENDASVEVEKLEALRDKLYKKIKSFQDACDSEQTKDAPSEDMEEFKKWRKRHDLGNKIYMNKVEKLIIENDDDYESLSSGESDGAKGNPISMTKQLMDCFKTMQVSAHLPQHEPKTFDGNDVTEYQSFMLTFRQTIENKCSSFEDKYYYLMKYTDGEANTLVKSCLDADCKKAYTNANALLEQRYGNEYIIAQQYISKLQNWNPIKAEDAVGMNSFAAFLTSVENLMHKMSSLNQLNSPRDIKEIVMKLPYQMRVQFRNKSAELVDKNEQIDFSVLVKFVNKQAKQLNVPLFGDISDKRTSKPDDKQDKPRKQINKSKTFLTNDNNNVEKYCPCCKKTNHVLNDCYFFARKSIADKEEFIKRQNLCYGCLKSSNHMSKDCKDKLTCRTCERKHPTCLHRDQNEQEKVKPKSSYEKKDVSHDQKVPTDARNINLVVKGATKIACPAVPVILRSKITNEEVRTYAALDNFSTASYMDQNLMKKLHIEGEKRSLEVTTIDSNHIKIDTVVAKNLEIFNLDKTVKLSLSSVYAKEKWPFSKDDSPSCDDVRKIEEFNDIPFNFINSKIGILIGMNEPEIIKPLQIVQPNENGPFASRHKLGWAINGPINGSSSSAHCLRTKTREVADLESKFDKVFNADFCEDKDKARPPKILSPDEERWLQFVEENCVKKEDISKFEISLPIKNEKSLPNNYLQVYNRLQTAKKKLLADDNLKEEYVNFMQMMKDRGYMEKVPEEEQDPTKENQWYLTHHGVHHKKKGKIRVVFDCSLQYKGISLNDLLWKGPDLTNSLVGVLMRFRNNTIAVSGDIEKMFYNVQVPREDRTYLRFLWFENNDLSLEPCQYWLTVHLFGATSSPAIANYALKKSVENKAMDVEQTVNESFYVDDLLSSFKNEDEAINTVQNVKTALKEASFNLTSFASNSSAVAASLNCQNQTSNNATVVKIPDENMTTTSALGMIWNTAEDTFNYDVKIPDQPNTRRGLLSTIFSIYDPLFLATPALIRAKRLFQITCAEKLGWDDPLPAHLTLVWMKWKEEVLHLTRYSLPRCYIASVIDSSEVKDIQLHVFTDGSEIAYGAVAYLRYEDSSNKIHTSIIMSKSRLTPLDRKSLKTVPRIELNAAKLGVMLYEKIKEELPLQNVSSTYFWTDSKSTLQYILNETHQLQRFVANRVAYIRSETDTNSWKHVPGELNPADQLSRGVARISKFVEDETWTKGPHFLSKSQDEWPSDETLEDLQLSDQEVKKKKFILSTNAFENDPLQTLINSTNDLHKLSCRIATFLRLKDYLKTKKITTGRITIEEIRSAEDALWKYHQTSHFAETLQMLRKPSNVPVKNPLKKLNPFIGTDGLMRVGGRLTNAHLPYASKHPIILHGSSQLVKILLQKIHRESGHLGRETVLAVIKETFHVIKVNKIVRQIIDKCVICRKVQRRPERQQMANLPEDRTAADAPPFTNTGTDVFGPFFISRGRGNVQEKRYGVIFTCLVSRATHIEVSPGLDTDSFINAFRRFIARRGKPKIMRSDNGTNLTSAEKELKAAINDWNKDRIHEYCLQENVDWKFQPPMSSHFGGVFERQIRTFRKIFNSLLYEINIQTKLTDDILNTLFVEVENLMNNIPLTVVTSDVHDAIPLTPNTLLRMQATTDFPPCLPSRSGSYHVRTWRRVQHMVDVFWTRFKKEYLPLINHRQKWTEKRIV